MSGVSCPGRFVGQFLLIGARASADKHIGAPLALLPLPPPPPPPPLAHCAASLLLVVPPATQSADTFDHPDPSSQPQPSRASRRGC